MDIPLTPEWEQFIQDNLQAGGYQSAGDIVCEGLKLLHHQALCAKLNRKIDKGLDDVANQRTQPAQAVRAYFQQKAAQARSIQREAS